MRREVILLYVMVIVNIAFMYKVLSVRQDDIIVVFAILAIAVSIVLSLKSKTDEESFSSFKIFDFQIDYSGLPMILYGFLIARYVCTLGGASALVLTYFALLLVFMVSNIRLRIKKVNKN